MTIVNQTFGLLGQTGVTPRRVQLVVTDDLTVLTTAGYLTEQGIVPNTVYPTDIVDCIYSYDKATDSGTYSEFTVSVAANGVITLVQDVAEGNVSIQGAVTTNDFAVYSATTNKIKDLGFKASDATKTNVVMLSAAPSTVNLPAVFADTAGTIKNMTKANGTEAANAVTANGQAGVITTSALTTAGGASYAITWTNSFVATGSTILLSLMGGTNTVKPITLQAAAGNGTSTLTIYNNTAATALDGTIIIGYQVL